LTSFVDLKAESTKRVIEDKDEVGPVVIGCSYIEDDKQFQKPGEGLNSVGPIPSTTSNNTFTCNWASSAITGPAQYPKTENSTCKPEDRRQESKGNIGFPPLADAFLRNVAPVENVTAVQGPDKVDQEGKRHDPQDKHY